VVNQLVVGMPSQFSVAAARCFLIFVVFAHYAVVSDVTSDVRDDGVTERPRSAASRDGICPRSCPSQEVLHQLPQADVIRLHVERIKRELLRKLGLSAPPNVTGQRRPSVHSFPPPLLSAGAGDEEEDGVFPDDGFDYGAAMMSDDVGGPGQRDSDYQYHDDDDDDDDDDEYQDEADNDADVLDGERDDDDDELGPPPRSRQIIVFGQQRMSITLKLQIILS